ncbi:MAG: CoA transferase [Acidimicrobiia bacterium]|nr:CoA transferase [Acidimicrobiia bacterium]
MGSSARPLEGVRVLELGALVAAPYCGMLLADLGADVIKIEPPEGDMARHFAPFVAGESAFFMSVNRRKRSVVLDLKQPEAVSWVHEMVKRSDVVLHNYRVGVAERIGVGYEELTALSPGLVYCAISGFGPTGPMAHRPAIDLLFQAESGMMAITGERDGSPVKVGTNAADVYAATIAAACINAALVRRARTGQGQRVDVSLRDAFLALQACWFTSFLATGEQPERLGAGSPFTAPTDVFPTQDDRIVLAVVNSKHWQILCGVLGLEHLVEEVRFASNEARVENAAELRDLVSEVLTTRSTEEWIELFGEAGIPAGRVCDYRQVVADEQIRHNAMVLEFDHPTAGAVMTQGIPFWLDGEKNPDPSPPPTLGRHTRQVLIEMGCPPDEADDLAGVHKA